MAKLDIFKLDWIDVVFAGRNQAYGAYELRKNNSKTTSRALLIGCTVFIVTLGSSTAYKHLSGFVPAMMDKFKETEVTLTPPPPLEATPPPPPPPPPPAAAIKAFPPPFVVEAKDADEEPPAQADLVLLETGSKTIEGDPNAGNAIEVVEAPKETKIVEESGPVQMESVQVLPEFPGGRSSWANFLSGYNYPAMARENNIQGTVYVTFVVEKDGSLSDISVLRDLQFGTGEEAVRLLKTSPKWSPGIQNGRPVRVAYTQPIALKLN